MLSRANKRTYVFYNLKTILNVFAGWFLQSRLPKAFWSLAPNFATVVEPRPKQDRLVLSLTGLPHSLSGPLASGTCFLGALMAVSALIVFNPNVIFAARSKLRF